VRQSLSLSLTSIQIRVSHMCDLHNDNWHRDQVHDGSQLPEQHHVSNGTSDVCDRLDLAHSHAPSSRVSRRLLEASWHVCLSFIFSILSLSHKRMIDRLLDDDDWDLDRIADHSPWPEDYEEANFAATSSSWESLFGIKMSEESKTGPWKESESDGDTFRPSYW